METYKSREERPLIPTSFDGGRGQFKQLQEEFTPQLDSFEQEDDDVRNSMINQPPYTSPKNAQKQHTTTTLTEETSGQAICPIEHESQQQEQQLMRCNNDERSSSDDMRFAYEEGQGQVSGNMMINFKDEPVLSNVREDPRLLSLRPFHTSATTQAHGKAGGGSAKPIRNMNFLDEKGGDTLTHEKTAVKCTNNNAILEDLDDMLYLEMQQKSAEGGHASVSGQLLLLNNEHSEGGLATTRKPFGKTTRDQNRLVSATCRYSSWERAYHDDGDEDDEEDSLVDSLSRILNNPMDTADSEQHLGKDDDNDENEQPSANLLFERAKADASQLQSLALELCSTQASVTTVTEKGQELDERLSQIEKLIEEGDTLTKSKLKRLLRIHNVGLDAKRFHGQSNLQKDFQILLGTANEMQERNARLVNRQRKRLQSYERELYSVLQSIQDFQFRSAAKPRDNSQLGKISTFTGYNGMRLGEEDVQAAPGMLLGGKNNQSVVTAYGSQGPIVRDTSQMLTTLQGMTSILTNSHLKMNTAVINSHSSSGEVYQQKEDVKMTRQYASNILIADQSDNSIIGQFKQRENSQENLITNAAMVTPLTQRSHNLGGAFTYTEDQPPQLASQRKPQTARCGSSTFHTKGTLADKSLLLYGGGGVNGYQSRALGGFLESLHEKLRSLTERIHEVIQTKLRFVSKEKSYQALSSMKSQMRCAFDDKKSKSRRNRSDSKHCSVRGSSKSRRLMRFQRFKDNNNRDYQSLEQRKTKRRRRQENQSSLQSCSPIGSSRINPFNRAFIKSTYRGVTNQQDTASVQFSGTGDNSQFFSGVNTYFHFGGPAGDTQQYHGNLYPMSRTQAMLTRQQSFRNKGDPKILNKFIDEQTRGGPRSARNAFDIGHIIPKPSETVPVTNQMTRLNSANLSHDHESLPNQTKKQLGSLCKEELFAISKQPPSSPVKRNDGRQRPIDAIQEQLSPRGTPITQHGFQPPTLSLSKLSDRRQEFSATFNNQLSSVKKDDNESSDANKSADGLIPNFYAVASTSPFELSSLPDQGGAKQLLHPAKQSRRKKQQTNSKNAKAAAMRGKFETEDAPKIPKLNLGKLKTGNKHDYFTKNISEYDDTSLGDYEMILRNQKFNVNSSKDPSILTASKSQNNQSIGSYQSRFQLQNAAAKRKVTKDKSLGKNNGSKKHRTYKQCASKQAIGAQTNRGGDKGVVSHKKGHGNGAGTRGQKFSTKTNNSSYYKDVLRSSPKVLFNNLTGVQMSGFRPSKPHASQREDKIATAATIFRGQQIVDHPVDRDLHEEEEGDLYMSFIDSDKFSPIQSVSGEDIDDDDSLNHQKAEILFNEEVVSLTAPPGPPTDHVVVVDIVDDQAYECNLPLQITTTNEDKLQRKGIVAQQQQRLIDPQAPPAPAQSAREVMNVVDLQSADRAISSDFASSFENLLHQIDQVQQQQPQLSNTAQQKQEMIDDLNQSVQGDCPQIPFQRAVGHHQKNTRGSPRQPPHKRKGSQPQNLFDGNFQPMVTKTAGGLPKTPKSSGKATHRSKSSSKSPKKTTRRLNKQTTLPQKSQALERKDHSNQGATTTATGSMQKLMGKQKMEKLLSQQNVVKKGLKLGKLQQNPSPRNEMKMVKKGLGVNSAAKFGHTDSNNFTLGATNINVFTLSPRAFSSSMLSSLSKELISNLSSGQKNQPFVFSFQGSQTKMEQVAPAPQQQYLVDPQGIQIVASNPLSGIATAGSTTKPATIGVDSLTPRHPQPYQAQHSKKSIKTQLKQTRYSASKEGLKIGKQGSKSASKERTQSPGKQAQVIAQDLPRHVSHRQINENILVLPLQMQQRRQLQKNESQASKKSLCLQEAFPEAVITLNKEILEKRLSNRGSYQSVHGSTGPVSGLKSARESYKTFMTAEQAIRDSNPDMYATDIPIARAAEDQAESRLRPWPSKNLSLPPQTSSSRKKIPPKAPQTTRNVIKINNLMGENRVKNDPQSSKPIKFNFNLKPSAAVAGAVKKDRAATTEDDSAAIVTSKKRVAKTRQLHQLRTTYGSTQRQSCKIKDFNGSGMPPSMSLLSPTVTTMNDINNSAQTILLPQSTPNQSSSKLTYRKFHPAQFEQSATVTNTDDYDLSSATPRTQTMVIPRSQVTRQSDNDLSCSQRGASFLTMDATQQPVVREKVVQQLMLKLVRQHTTQKRGVTSAAGSTTSKSNSMQKTKKKTSLRQRLNELETRPDDGVDPHGWGVGSQTTKAAANETRPLKTLGIKRRKLQAQGTPESFTTCPSQQRVGSQKKVIGVPSSSPLRSKILQRQSELTAIAKSCVTLEPTINISNSGYHHY